MPSPSLATARREARAIRRLRLPANGFSFVEKDTEDSKAWDARSASSALGFCLPNIQAVWRGFSVDSVLPKLFSGEKDLAKPQPISRAEEGSGKESARAFPIFILATIMIKLDHKY
ncbi:MAG: hypothetical protein Q7R94_00890 [bacterium]|nr:hypothetical protein [bacterium]